MEVVGEAFLSTALGFLFNKLASSDLIKFARQEDVHTELKKWEKELQSIRKELNDAEEKQITEEAVKSWLFDLKVLAYDMEDILDDFAYELMRRKLMGEEDDEASTSRVRKFIPICCTSFNPTHVVRNVTMASKIREITSRLQDISARKAGLGLEKAAGAATSAWQRPLPTTPIAHEPGVYGRDEDKKVLLDLLCKAEPNENNVGVVSIVGMGGLGKTTLARLVYNDEMTKNFDLKAWVCVSDVFDVENITKAILDSVESSGASDSLSFQQVQKKLTEALTRKKFLLILDDVWNEDCGHWDSLRAPFSVGAKGSKVIVTTRNKKVALIMGAEENLHELKTLSEDACWSVFKQHAFEYRSIDDHPKLVSIGRKIVSKCGGLPLAATTLGGLLRSQRREDEWEKILNSKIWGGSCTEPEILPALRLSYHYLPSHLKRCFAYCAMFPKDYEFDSKKLVLLWMAEGLIQQPKGNRRTMEDLGYDYFCELLSRSFFQSSSNHESCFVMHDLIHDLAQSVAGEICFCLEDELDSNRQSTISKETRHSSFVRGTEDVLKKFEAFQEVKHLRTFVAFPSQPNGFSMFFLTRLVCDDLVPKFRHLRVLSLFGYMIIELPDSIGELKHLRYLDLSYTQIRSLPDSVSNLYNLQTLILQYCSELLRLPPNIGSLINLRHLDVDVCSLQEMPQQIGKLKNLQTLSNFIVGKSGFLGIKELKHLSHLRGKIRISRLENVVDIQDAIDANLRTKLNVEELIMIWRKAFHDLQNEMEVLLSLQPHTNLKKLNINCYGGRQFPNWICDSSYSELVELKLLGCIRCTSLPSVGQLPFLKKLVIKGMDQVRSVGLEFEGQVSLSAKPFERLESLRFEDMKEWEEWSWSTESFSRLLKLKIKGCPRLGKKLPTHLPTLVKLEINNCSETMVPLPTHLSSLKELNICYCPGLRSSSALERFVPLSGGSRSAIDVTSRVDLRIHGMSGLFKLEEKFLRSLPRLQPLEIDNSGKLNCLWENGLGLGNLASLRVLDCNQLVSLGEEEVQELPCNLQCLEIRRCDNLEKLLHGLYNYASLTELIISDCPKLVSFPDKGFPLMLRRLSISNCRSLSSLPDGMMVRNSSNSSSITCVLEELDIIRCPSLIFFAKWQLPTTLKSLYIHNCENLKSLPEDMDVCALERIMITGCQSLIGFPKVKLPSTLEHLEIRGCKKLESLPEGIMHHHSNNTTNCGLKVLNIYGCSSLTSFPRGRFVSTIETILIRDCAQLQPLSEEMFDHNNNAIEQLTISGYPNLKTIPNCLYNLKYLRIEKCENLELQPCQLQSLISLTSLEIIDCENIKTPLSEWGLSRLTSLKTLTISDYHHHLHPPLLLPTALVEVEISRFENLESLAFLSLQRLTSLKMLRISRCPKLQSFLPREGLSDTLSRLYIYDCPLLIQRCSKEKGEDWPKISHIPRVRIDDRSIFEQ